MDLEYKIRGTYQEIDKKWLFPLTSLFKFSTKTIQLVEFRHFITRAISASSKPDKNSTVLNRGNFAAERIK